MKLKYDESLNEYGIQVVGETKILPLGGKAKTFDVFNIPLSILNYNLRNGRIFMEVNRLQQEENIELMQLMNENPEEYNNEIENLIWHANLERNSATMADIEKFTQLEAGVVLDDGTVIDGNRRFTCLRRLNKKYPDDPRFAYFRAAIVFSDRDEITKKELKKYELEVQFGRDEKVDYKTINFNMSIYEYVDTGEFTINEIANTINKTPGHVSKIIRTCELVTEFLSYIGRDAQLALAEELNIYWPLEPLDAYLTSKDAKILDAAEIEERKHLYFDHILTLNVGLPTQNLRDTLIKTIFKNDDLYEELTKKYKEHYEEIVFDTIINNKNESVSDFIESIKDIKEGPVGKGISDSFNKVKERAGIEKTIERPLIECDNIIEILDDINITPLLESDSSVAQERLTQISGKMTEAREKINSLIISIENKLKEQ